LRLGVGSYARCAGLARWGLDSPGLRLGLASVARCAGLARGLPPKRSLDGAPGVREGWVLTPAARAWPGGGLDSPGLRLGLASFARCAGLARGLSPQRSLDGAPGRWGELGISPIRLADWLRPLRVAPRQIRVGENTMKGYARSEMEAAWKRYLPAVVSSTETSETNPVNPEGRSVLECETAA